MKSNVILTNETRLYVAALLPIVMLTSVTILVGIILASSTVFADNDSVVDEVNITVPVSCTMSGTGMNTHNAEINNGTYVGSVETDAGTGETIAHGIGRTNVHAFCNDNEGFAIYAAGYTGNEVGGANSNKLVGTAASNYTTIATGTAVGPVGGNDISNWAMAITPVSDSGDTSPTNAFTIDSDASGSFSMFHAVPNEYTKVAHKNSGTDMTDTTGGIKFDTTYAAYISKIQPADTYSGQVIYTLVHPSSAVAGKLNVNFDGNGLTFPNGKSTNLVAYEATEVETTDTITKKSYANAYNEEGGYSTSTIHAPVGNRVVTIDGAERIHIAVTYGVPQNNGGPQSDLYIFSGNHPEYTNADSSSAIQTCGTASATNGAYSTTGSGGTQVTMECDIASDSVTFYDYSSGTSNQYSVGYYAVITGQGTTTSYNKTIISGTYSNPSDNEGVVFLGWSTDPNAVEPAYFDESDFIENANYTNADGTIVLYAIWQGDFNKVLSHAGKSRLNGYYKMQDADTNICDKVLMESIGTLIDERDNTIYMIRKLKDGRCWMLDNLALDLTDPTTAMNLDESNTNATTEAINNLLHGGSTTTGWSNVAVADVDISFNDSQNTIPRINNSNKNTLVTSYGPASIGGQAKVGIYYNFCAASASTYCYIDGSDTGVDVPNTDIDAPQDVCPRNWRMPTSGYTGEYYTLAQKYNSNDATNPDSFQYNLSIPLSGYYNESAASNLGGIGRWWSSTYDNIYGMHVLSVDSYIWPNDYSSRSSGLSMRCLMGE